MRCNPAAANKDEARDEEEAARRIQDGVDVREGEDKILHAESYIFIPLTKHLAR